MTPAEKFRFKLIDEAAVKWYLTDSELASVRSFYRNPTAAAFDRLSAFASAAVDEVEQQLTALRAQCQQCAQWRQRGFDGCMTHACVADAVRRAK